MKKTQILVESKKQFNELGVANVTIRMVAKSLKMSSGNLNYHFKKRKNILEALFEEIETFENEFIDAVSDKKITVGKYKKVSLAYMEKMADYRFAWLDHVQLGRESDKIKKLQKTLFQNRVRSLDRLSASYLTQWLYSCSIGSQRFSQRTVMACHKEFIEFKE
jgi:AcrR family transcriptional regulator